MIRGSYPLLTTRETMAAESQVENAQPQNVTEEAVTKTMGPAAKAHFRGLWCLNRSSNKNAKLNARRSTAASQGQKALKYGHLPTVCNFG